jgi:AcrR family transcriptional regulator
MSLVEYPPPTPGFPLRSDSRRTRTTLIEAIGTYVSEHGGTPDRLADLAAHSGISLATVYRHFSSVDELVQAHVVQLPERTAHLFDASNRRHGRQLDDYGRLHTWNESWVRASLEFGPTAVYLRSPMGFLSRRRSGDATVMFVCRHVEPLLQPFTDKHHDVVALLTTWNAVSDPREILDLRSTARWSAQRIASYITETTLARMSAAQSRKKST